LLRSSSKLDRRLAYPGETPFDGVERFRICQELALAHAGDVLPNTVDVVDDVPEA
jgi:hypothetical protein